MYYFAYGSNLHPYRLRDRVGSADLIGTLVLDHFRVVCNKRGRDGSAKANLVSDPGARAHGVIYRIPDGAWSRLDRFEGPGYQRLRLRDLCEIQVPGPTETYIARANWLTGSLKPYTWYRALMVCGARHHEFPGEYVAWLQGLEAAEDPDPGRGEFHRQLLDAIKGEDQYPG